MSTEPGERMDGSVQDKSEETKEKEDAPNAEIKEQAGRKEPQSESADTTEPSNTEGQQPEIVVDQNPPADCNKSDDTPKESKDVNVEEKKNVNSGIQKDDNPEISDGNPKVPNDGNPSECPEENRENSSVEPDDKTLQNPMDPNPEVPSQNQNPDAPVDQPTEHTEVPGNKDVYVPKDNSTDDLEGNVSPESKVPKLAEPSTTPDEPNNAIPSEMKQKENSTEPEATPDKQNEGADQDLNPSVYSPHAEPKSLDKGKTDDPQQSSTEPGVADQVDMSPQVNQNRDEDVNRVNTYKEEDEQKPWELSEDEHPSPPETTNPDQGRREEKEDGKVFLEEEEMTPQEIVDVLFIGNPDQTAVLELISNCKRYQKELKIEDDILESAKNDYMIIQKKAGETGYKISKNTPPSELKSVTDEEKREAPSLFKVISIVAKKCPNYGRWQDAVSEFITLTTYARPEPHQSKTKRSTSVSSSGYQPKRPKKEYRDNIHKLLDQEWEEDTPLRSGIDYDYRHLLTSQSVLRSEFPEANILDEVDIKVRSPDEVPNESRHRALYHFLSKIDMAKCGVDPAQAWNDYCRLTLAEKQLDLARRARGPDLDLNVILKKDKYNKLLKELKEKTEEIEELSTRLSRFASQQLTEGNPNIADLSDTHRPTRLGEMYSQLFDDEWSEAFEAFKNKADGNEDDDDIFPDTLFILQNILTQIFQFCQVQSERQKVELEDGFAVAVGLKQAKVIMVAKVEEEIERKAKTESLKSKDTNKDEDEVVKDANTSEPDAQEKDNSLTGAKGTGELTEQPKEDTEETKECMKTENREEVNNQERDAPKSTTSPDSDGSGNKDEDKDAKSDEHTSQFNPDQGTVNPESGVTSESGESNDKTLETNEEINETEMDTKPGKGLEKDTDKVEETTSDGNKNDTIKNPAQIDEVMDSTDKKDTALNTEKEADKTSEDDRSNEKAAWEKAIQREILLEIARTTEEQNEDRSYRQNSVYSTIERHAREIRKALAATSAKTKSKLFIDDDLPLLIPEKVIREDARIMLYVQKCLELCWYMRMQDPPMVIVTPTKGQEVDKTLFSFHGRRGKTVEVCVWPALLLHENGPLVCKGYVLPEEKKRKKEK